MEGEGSGVPPERFLAKGGWVGGRRRGRCRVGGWGGEGSIRTVPPTIEIP